MTLNNLLQSLKVDINIMIYIYMGSKGKISKKSMAQAENFSSIYYQHVVQSFNNCFHKNCHVQANPAQ